jgi:hypothetical protein
MARPVEEAPRKLGVNELRAASAAVSATAP